MAGAVICKNCEYESNLSYCPQCGQKVQNQLTLRNTLLQMLEVMDLKKGLPVTFFFLFFRPGRLINDFFAGKTKPYLHAVSFLLITIGSTFLISETKILGMEVTFGNQFQTYLDIIIPIAIVSLIVGYIPYMKLNPAKVLVINFYFISGFFIIAFLSDVSYLMYWRYELPTLFRNTFPIAVVFAIYYFGSVFKLAIHKSLTNLFLIISLTIAYDYTTALISPKQQLKMEDYQDLPFWVEQRILGDSERFVDFELVSKKVVITDITGNGVRDAIALFGLKNGGNRIAAFHFLEGQTHLLNLSNLTMNLVDIRPDSILKTDDVKNSLKLIEISSSKEAILTWNGEHYFLNQKLVR